MSLSAEHRGPDHHNSSHDEGPSFHDLIKPVDDRKGVTKGHSTGPGEAPLVEHILDFLDKYPACFAPCSSLTGCIRAC